MNFLRFFILGLTFLFFIGCGGNSNTSNGKKELDFSKAFIIKWKVTKDDKNIIIPTKGSGYDYSIDWGDGTVETNLHGNKIHTYEKEGEYEVKIIGDFPRIYFRGLTESGEHDTENLLEITQWGDNKWSSMNNAFYNCVNMKITAKDIPNLSRILDMSYMFFGAFSFNQDISSWDVSHVKNMSYTFANENHYVDSRYANYKFNQPLNSWDVSSVTNMEGMFAHAFNFNQDLNLWDVSSVTNMSKMFQGDTESGHSLFNGNIGTWNVSKVKDMAYMFNNAESFNQDLNLWDVSSVTNMSNMFSVRYFNAEEEGLGIPSKDRVFNGNIEDWDVSSVTNMRNMFNFSNHFNQDISKWDVSSVKDMYGMLDYTNLSVLNYSKLLNSWSQLSLQPNVTFGAKNKDYTSSVSRNRAYITSTFGWNITDGTNTPIDYPLALAQGTEYILNASEIISHDSTNKAYTWKEGNNILSSDINFSTAELSIGEHNITLIIGSKVDENAYKETLVINIMDINSITPLIMNIKTSSSAITIRHNGEKTFYMIDWGDGTQSVNIYKTETHTYENSGVYQVQIKIAGDTPISLFKDIDILSIEQWGNFKWSSCNNLFSYHKKFNINASDKPDLSEVKDMRFMFAYSEFDQDISEWDVSNVQSMDGLFEGSSLSTLNYNNLLIEWSKLNLQKNVRLDMGNSKYTSESKEAREKLISNYNWIISDGGIEE